MNDFRQIPLIGGKCLLFNDENTLRSLRILPKLFAVKFNAKERGVTQRTQRWGLTNHLL